eukprot:TRINITY_DN26350_c0_g2_i1.p1 TRINITY_DN26350_c0_g2~~TRINITY_DN26350_c0_g2_i1.p1  ORF type:complete len:472 (+),score=70.86 TRINITY_DN26350_c0_g2_i1:82-1497(+)
MPGVLSVRGARGSNPCLTVTLSVAAYVVLRQVVQLIRQRGTPPGQMGLPFGLGETISYMLGVGDFVQKRVKKYGGIFKTHVLFSPTIFVTGEENVKWFFKSQKEVGWPETWNQLMGKTLTTVNGDQHKFQRMLVGRAFTDEALSSYLPSIEQFTEEHLQKLVAKSAAGAFNPAEEIKRYTYSVAERVALGKDMEAGGAMNWFTTWLKGFEALTSLNMPFTCFGQAMHSRKALLTEYKRILDKRRRMQQDGATAAASTDILSNVFQAEESGKGLTDQEILDFLIVVMFAGHDTTLAMIQDMLFLLGQKPELRAELEAEVSSLWDGESPLTYDMCTDSTPKCRHFIEETLRAFPPVTALFRRIPEDITYKGYKFPKGWKVAVSVQYEHFAAENQRFHGEAFDFGTMHESLPINKNLTFSHGLRLCIGYKLAKLELRVWLMHFLANYKLKVHESSISKFPFNHATVKISMASKV